MCLIVLSCSTPHRLTRDSAALDISQLSARRSELDGTQIEVDGYLTLARSIEAPGYFYYLTSAEQGANGVNVCRASEDTQLLVVGPRSSRALLGRRRVLVTGIYHAQSRGVWFGSIEGEFHGWLGDAQVEHVYDERCESLPR